MALFAAHRAQQVLRTFRNVMQHAPDELSLACAFITAPEEDDVPTELWVRGSRSRPEPVTSGDRQPGMIEEVALRLLYLIFSHLLSWLTLLPRASPSKDIELSSFCATKSPYSAEATPSHAWTGPTEPCSLC